MSHKKLRDSEEVFVAEGPKLINELLSASNVALQQLFAVKEWIEKESPKLTATVTEVTGSELERISLLQTPNQVLGVFKKPAFTQAHSPVSLVLDTIQDPGNLGTIIRCADWFGINHVICSPDSADAFNAKVVQSSMGSIARVQVTYSALTDYLTQHANIPTYGAVLNGTDIRQLEPLKEGIIIIGNESKGISDPVMALCRHRITIPRTGQAESLNAAVATGIILSHLA